VILADTSVWISHLRKGVSALQALLLEGEIVCHPFIIGELACGNIKNRTEFLALMQALPMLPVVTQGEFLHFVDSNKLMGTGIGFVDIHLLASSRLIQIPLWTEDTKLQATAKKLKLLYSE